MARRKRNDSLAYAVEAANKTLPTPPSGFDFDAEQMEAWWELARSRREWRDVDLRCAAEIIELLRDQRELREIIRREGRFVLDGGKSVPHHAQTELLKVGKQILSYYRTLGLRPRTDPGTLNQEVHPNTKKPGEASEKKGVKLLATG